jgi:hypothetical protein
MTDQEFKQRLEEWLSIQFNKQCVIEELKSLSGGACQENSLITLKFVDDSSKKGLFIVPIREVHCLQVYPENMNFA